jgi:sulfatase maturation enzyme AslB (radical SAM superfamily)
MRTTLEFTLSVSKCLSCSYCPQSKLGAAYPADAARVMSRPVFETILDKLPRDADVHFSGFSEVFLNRDAGEMIAIASSSLSYQTHLYTTLMGLSARQAEHLKRAKLAYVRLHVPDTVGLKIKNEIWLRQFNLFLTTGHRFTAMAMGPIDPDLKTILARRGVEVETPEMLSRAGNLWEPRNLTGRRMHCTMDRWHSNVVLPNGDVVGDCMDYGLTVRLGNLLLQPYEEIYAAAEQWRQKMEASASGICAFCEWGIAI